jgi:thymidylate synthase (FAD)
VARQWVRHRTANINEYSLRYSEARDEFYYPDPKHIQLQSALNKQGRTGKIPKKLTDKVLQYFKEISERSFEMYQELNEAGLARELIRAILPVNLYTEWYWKNDLHNLLHFISLRSDSHAQYEIRVFSDAMAESVRKVAPFAWEAYQDYVVQGMRFSRIEQSLLEKQLPPRVVDDILEDVVYQITATLHKNKPREEADLYPLHQKQGGSDSEDDFKLKWDSGEIETGNVRELREFKGKLISLKK